MNRLIACVAVVGLSPLAIPAAFGEFSANVALSSDYVWRGVSQTDSGAAVSGGFDFSHSSGIYLGTWASNVDFGDGDDSNIEIDLYGGIAHEYANGIGVDLGIIHYDYPSQEELNFQEWYLGLSYRFASIKVSHRLDEGEDDVYYEAGLDFELPLEVGLGLHVGRYEYDDDALDDYTDYKAALTRSYGGFDFEVAYVGTSDTEDDNHNNDDRGVVSISKSF